MALQVANVETGTCEAQVTRTGLFGDIRVQWKAGYPSGQAPPDFRIGAIVPTSGKMVSEKLSSERLNCCGIYCISSQHTNTIILSTNPNFQ